MPNYLRVTSTNPLRVERNASRPSLPKDNVPLKEDYLRKTGTRVISPQKQGLSQDHRYSDADIRDNIISDINSDFVNDCTSILIETVFPWNPNGIEKAEARRLYALVKFSADNTVKLESANKLIELMSRHSENLSYGNSSQNSAIKQCLDLNAPRDRTDRHSLSPRSRHIATALYTDKQNVVFSPPKMKLRSTFFSSQYGPGGKANKEQADIQLSKTTPRTGRLLQEVIKSSDAYDSALTFFHNLFGAAHLKTIQSIPNHGLVLLHERYQDLLDEVLIDAEEFFGTPLTKLELMSDGTLLTMLREEECCWYELSNLSEAKLTLIKAHAAKIHEVMRQYGIPFSEINLLSPVELPIFLGCDLGKAILEYGYSLKKLIKLYRQDPLHLTCLTSDLPELVKRHEPNVPELVLKYAKEFGHSEILATAEPAGAAYR